MVANYFFDLVGICFLRWSAAACSRGMPGLILFVSVLLVCSPAVAQNSLPSHTADDFFAQGMALIQHRNYGGAQSAFGRFLNVTSGQDPRRAEASYYEAYTSVRLGHADGEKKMDDFVSTFPGDPLAGRAFFDLANSFYDDHNYSKAVSFYKKTDLSTLEPTQRLEARFRWGYSQFNLRRFDEALEQFNAIKNQSSQYTPAASYYAGFIYYSDAQYDKALIDFQRASGFPAYAGVVPHLICLTYYKQRNFDELIKYTDALASRSSEVANYDEILSLAADAHYFRKEYAEAAAKYESGFANGYKADPSMLFRAGYSNYASGKDQKAIEYLKVSAGSDSVSVYASYYLGLIYLKQGNKVYALNSFDVARKNASVTVIAEESMYQYGKIAYDLGRPDQAISIFEQFKRTYPSSTHIGEVNELLAQAYVNGNNYNKAIEYIEAMPRRSPAIDAAYQKATYLKGAELFNMNQFDEAVKNFEASLKYPIDKKYVGLSALWCGEACSARGRYEEAIPNYLTALGPAAASDNMVTTKARYGLGYAYFNQEMYDKALVNFKDYASRSGKNDPNFVDGLIRLGDCYFVAKAYNDALTTYSRARSFNSADNDYLFLQMGMIYGITRKYSEARTQFDLLINSYPRSTYRDEGMFQRAQFEMEQGNYDAAVRGLTQLIGEMRSSKFLPYAFMRRAAANFNLKDYEKTINDYVFVLRNFSTHPVAQQALLPLQEVLNITGRSAEFDGYLNAYKQANPENRNLEVVEFEAAKSAYFNQQYSSAIERLSGFIRTYPGSPRVSEAKYYLAESYYRQNRFDEALPVYYDLAKDTTFPEAVRVFGRIGELEYRKGSLKAAVAAFHRQEGIAETKKDLYNAWSGLMESLFLLTQYDSTDYYARQILDKGVVGTGAQNKATLYLGKTAMAKGDYETAKDEFLSTVNTARDEYGAEAKYHIGEIFYFTKQYRQCYETLTSLNTEFSAYDQWVGRSFLLLADNFLAMGDRFQARATLQSLIDNFPTEYIKNQAREKLRAIEREEAKPKQDTTQTPR